MDFSGFLTVCSSEMLFRVHFGHILMHFGVPIALTSILKSSKLFVGTTELADNAIVNPRYIYTLYL